MVSVSACWFHIEKFDLHNCGCVAKKAMHKVTL